MFVSRFSQAFIYMEYRSSGSVTVIPALYFVSFLLNDVAIRPLPSGVSSYIFSLSKIPSAISFLPEKVLNIWS